MICFYFYLATRQRGNNELIDGLKQRMPAPRLRTLWIYGDSLGVRFHNSLSRKPLCWRIFASCSRTYNWVYPIPYENEALGKSLTDEFDFRPSIILDTIRNVLRDNRMKSSQSLMVLNLGLHYPPSISFATYQKLIDDVIVMLLDRERRLGSKAKVIWKTTTSLRKENEEPPRNSTSWRFFTEQVRHRHVFFQFIVRMEVFVLINKKFQHKFDYNFVQKTH